MNKILIGLNPKILYLHGPKNYLNLYLIIFVLFLMHLFSFECCLEWSEGADVGYVRLPE